MYTDIYISVLQLPPSYEQVIKEINQVQVNTTNNNNAAAPRHTTTSATQTDFPQELISHLPGSNVETSVPTHWEPAGYPGEVVLDFSLMKTLL